MWTCGRGSDWSLICFFNAYSVYDLLQWMIILTGGFVVLDQVWAAWPSAWGACRNWCWCWGRAGDGCWLVDQETEGTFYSILLYAVHLQTISIINRCSNSSQRSLTIAPAGRSGLLVARLSAAREVPGSNLHCWQFQCFSRKSLRYTALGTGCTLTAVPRLTQPFTLRGTVNEYQPYGDGWTFSLQQPTGRLEGQFHSLAYELPASWRLLTCTLRTRVGCFIWLCTIDDSTIKIGQTDIELYQGSWVDSARQRLGRGHRRQFTWQTRATYGRMATCQSPWPRAWAAA